MTEKLNPVFTKSAIPHLRQNHDLSYIESPTGRAMNVPLGAIGFTGAFQSEEATQTGPNKFDPFYKGKLPRASLMATGDPFMYPPDPSGLGYPSLIRSPFEYDVNENFPLYFAGRLTRLSISFVDNPWFGFNLSMTTNVVDVDGTGPVAFDATAGLPPRNPPESTWEWWRVKRLGEDPGADFELLDSGKYVGIDGHSDYDGHSVHFDGPTPDQLDYFENSAIRVAMPGEAFLPIAPRDTTNVGAILGPFYYDVGDD